VATEHNRRFAAYAWATLGFNVLVVLWGTYVRATGSGAGCGDHWPLCDGQVVPLGARTQTLIEFSHRASSGVALLMVLGLLVWAMRSYPRKHRVRLGAGLSVVFMLTEALIGAGLVLFNQVAKNASITRGYSLSLHLVNTFTLLAMIALTAWWASVGQASRPVSISRWPLYSALAGLMLLGVSGAIAALGDTLFPAKSLAAGIREDFTPGANIFLKLRVFHPAIAVVVSAYLLFAVWFTTKRLKRSDLQWFALGVSMLVLVQLMLGVINLAMLAPLPMQLIHLFTADMVWIAAVLFTANTFETPSARAAVA
jgi:heme A synthase